MRIIRGKYGRRRFDVPSNITARPTTDFARENIFNVLENLIDFEGAEALDLYADVSVPYGEVVKVLNIANENDFKMVLATSAPDKKQ